MSITSLLETIESMVSDLDSLTHVPPERRDELRNKMEDLMEELDNVSADYGDEPLDGYDGDDDYDDDL